MISQDKMHRAVNSAVAQYLAEAGAAEPVPSNEEALDQVEELQPRSIPFDEVDSLKVANYLLRVRNERLLQEVEERRRKHSSLELDLASKEVHEELANKYGVDVSSFNIEIDAQKKTINVTAK
jgi:hypothetical protein